MNESISPETGLEKYASEGTGDGKTAVQRAFEEAAKKHDEESDGYKKILDADKKSGEKEGFKFGFQGSEEVDSSKAEDVNSEAKEEAENEDKKDQASEKKLLKEDASEKNGKNDNKEKEEQSEKVKSKEEVAKEQKEREKFITRHKELFNKFLDENDDDEAKLKNALVKQNFLEKDKKGNYLPTKGEKATKVYEAYNQTIKEREEQRKNKKAAERIIENKKILEMTDEDIHKAAMYAPEKLLESIRKKIK